jgi:hypothetical protein
VRFSWEKVAPVLESFSALEMVKMVFYRHFFFFIYPCSGALVLSAPVRTTANNTPLFFLKPCDGAPVWNAPVHPRDNDTPLCIFKRKNTMTVHPFVAHRCAHLVRTGARELLLYDVHHCFLFFLNNSATHSSRAFFFIYPCSGALALSAPLQTTHRYLKKKTCDGAPVWNTGAPKGQRRIVMHF